MTPGLVDVAGETGFPSSVTFTTTAAEFADVGMSWVIAVLLNNPVTRDGVISNVVYCEFGVLIEVSSSVPLPPDKPPELGMPPTVLIVHCDWLICAAKFPLLCARATVTLKAARPTTATPPTATLLIME